MPESGAVGVEIRWYGHASFLLTGSLRVAIDPFFLPDPPEPGITFDYPAIERVAVDLLLVTHEHRDHTNVGAFGGDPVLIRSSAGTFDSPVGTVVGVASEHDTVAGTSRGANVVYVFSLDGIRFCHLGDLGQAELREEQLAAIGDVDVLFVPVGGRMVLGGTTAAEVTREIGPRIAVPMHYGTHAVNYLAPADEFLDALGEVPVEQCAGSEFTLEAASLERQEGLRIVVPAPPRRPDA